MISIYIFVIVLDFWLFCHQTDQWSVWRQGACKTSRAATTAATLTVSNTARNLGNPFPFLFLAYQPVGTKCAQPRYISKVHNTMLVSSHL